MQFPPSALRFNVIFLLIPLILSVNFEAGAIDDNMRASFNGSSQSGCVAKSSQEKTNLTLFLQLCC